MNRAERRLWAATLSEEPDVGDDISAESWLPVVGWEGSYEVSDLGRVRSVDRMVPLRGCLTRRAPGRIRKLSLNPSGYLQLCLRVPGTQRARTVHRLVAEAFLGPCPDEQEVRHGPGGTLDNRVANLCYGTSAENKADMVRDGTAHWIWLETCPWGHRLASPNLRVKRAEHGHWSCLACHRASASVSYARKCGRALDFQVVADRHFAAIMRTVA